MLLAGSTVQLLRTDRKWREVNSLHARLVRTLADIDDIQEDAQAFLRGLVMGGKQQQNRTRH